MSWQPTYTVNPIRICMWHALEQFNFQKQHVMATDQHNRSYTNYVPSNSELYLEYFQSQHVMATNLLSILHNYVQSTEQFSVSPEIFPKKPAYSIYNTVSHVWIMCHPLEQNPLSPGFRNPLSACIQSSHHTLPNTCVHATAASKCNSPTLQDSRICVQRSHHTQPN